MFSTVFLCVKEKNKYVFTCKEFQSFLEADHYFKNKYTVVSYNPIVVNNNPIVVSYNPIVVNNNPIVVSYNPAVIPICKFMPQIIRRQVLQFKLASIFNRVSIS
jgi:hypothetical protein